jgi:hypothetical protein
MPEPAVGVRCVADATPQTSARLVALRFVLDCHERKEAIRPDSPDDAMKGSSDDRARTIIPNK